MRHFLSWIKAIGVWWLIAIGAVLLVGIDLPLGVASAVGLVFVLVGSFRAWWSRRALSDQKEAS